MAALSVADPYMYCPVYATDHFVLRLVEEGDAGNLLACYADPAAVALMNPDNCTSAFHFQTVEAMRECIRFWLQEYRCRKYVRLSVVEASSHTAVGTVEMFARPGPDGRPTDLGLLRIDLSAAYERRAYLAELLAVVNKHFYADFAVARIVTKAVPAAVERRAALRERGFTEMTDNAVLPGGEYYVR